MDSSFRAGTPTKADHEAHATVASDGTRLSAWLLRGRTSVAITIDGEQWCLQTKTPQPGALLKGEMWTPVGDELWCPADPATLRPLAWSTRQRPSPVALFEKNSNEVGAWCCTRCGIIYGASWYRLALACCAPRICSWSQGCADDVEQASVYCRTHATAAKLEQEESTFRSARKVPAATYQGWVFSEVDPDHDGRGYYADAKELLQHCQSEGITPPNYAWACDELHGMSDAEEIIEDALADHHDEASANIDPAQRKALQRFLDDWWRRNDVVSYVRSKTMAVLLDETHAADDRCGSCGAAADEACAPTCAERESPAPTRRK
jgi:hypothetical protein